jgi:16S rRNA (uracil1498-N3)-methyltransferase
MQFLYHALSGEAELEIENESYRYLIKARRQKVGDVTYLRNLYDTLLYTYKIEHIGRKSAQLSLFEQKEYRVMLNRNLHVGWSIIDPKVIEKSLPQLNQIGIDKITFIPADYSQKNFKLSYERFEKILINSCEQCGRSELMQLQECKDLSTFLTQNPQAAVLDFGGETVASLSILPDTILIGSEGGFSKNERKEFDNFTKIGLNSPLILRSETALLSVASQILFS